MPQLASLMRYPVKGLPGESMSEATLNAGEGIASDRRFALTATVASTMNGAWLGCSSFHINATQDGLLGFGQRFDSRSGLLVLSNPEGQTLSIDTRDEASIAEANRQLSSFLMSITGSSPFPAQLAIRRQSPGQLSGYWDFSDSAISLINARSVRAIGEAASTEIAPERFRGNLLIDDLPQWDEFAFPGKRLRLGEAELEAIRPAARCPATSVNPRTAIRDLRLPDTMMEKLGHNYCGIYVQVVKGGRIAPGDKLEVIGDASLPLDEACANGAPNYKLWPRWARITRRNDDRATIRTEGNWPLPEAAAGQAMRAHLKIGDVPRLTILETGDDAIVLETGGLKLPDRILVTGPYGRAQ
ncbi:MAG: MOSC domain-containing protein [Rhizobiaceae bacterium]